MVPVNFPLSSDPKLYTYSRFSVDDVQALISEFMGFQPAKHIPSYSPHGPGLGRESKTTYEGLGPYGWLWSLVMGIVLLSLPTLAHTQIPVRRWFRGSCLNVSYRFWLESAL